ncbi:MAG: glycosyltransferase family 2 protein [Planctomycetota bacterium]
MTARPLISIALATYNGERYLREQLDSIFAQTYDYLEVVAVDDGSSDRTVEILHEYAKTQRLVVHQNPENLGFLKNFERAISLCNGDAIALSDQDDIWLPDKLETLVPMLEENLLVYSDAELVDGDGLPLHQTIRDLHELQFVRGHCPRAFVFFECASGNTMLFRSDLKEFIFPIPDGFPYHDIWISFVAACRGRVDFVERPLLRYRRHGENISQRYERSPILAVEQWSDRREKLLQRFRALLRCPTIGANDRDFLETLIRRLERYRTTFFGFRLFWFLCKHHKEISPIKPEIGRIHRAWTLAKGLRLQRLLFRISRRLRGRR